MRLIAGWLGLLAVSGCASIYAWDRDRGLDTPMMETTGTQTLTCDGGRTLKITYGKEPDGTPNVILTIDGSDFRLLQEPGKRRYSWPSDGSNYVWLEDQRSLLWHDGETGTETATLTGC